MASKYFKSLLFGFFLLILIPSGSLVFAQTQDQTSVVTDYSSGQKVGTVQYNIINGNVDNMTVDVGANSLYIPISTISNGTLIVTLPRTLIDAINNGQDDQFYVLVDGQDTGFQESKTNIARTLTVLFPDGTSEIDVVGTYIAPEFPTGAALVLVISVISILVLSKRTRISFN